MRMSIFVRQGACDCWSASHDGIGCGGLSGRARYCRGTSVCGECCRRGASVCGGRYCRDANGCCGLIGCGALNSSHGANRDGGQSWIFDDHRSATRDCGQFVHHDVNGVLKSVSRWTGRSFRANVLAVPVPG
ncbi:MAG: hypothetical protein ACYSTF_07335 [Planctomycetota bacterium]